MKQTSPFQELTDPVWDSPLGQEVLRSIRARGTYKFSPSTEKKTQVENCKRFGYSHLLALLAFPTLSPSVDRQHIRTTN
ncbi:hypothetical protein BS47DRAFT_975142 [Hydnum rufescens UP504]|uniref:Uncharacterized protein n=1 Tax=Hydnum rufescens UP504 TaxID=1448309 RepID=A0A9P6AWV7_9AGAM|nr:hypothetical protein BS47DRAFT_975142 [Hydnum rufescens UP504]